MALLSGFLAVATDAAELPRKAPELTIALPGTSVNIGSYRGKVVALAFIVTT